MLFKKNTSLYASIVLLITIVSCKEKEQPKTITPDVNYVTVGQKSLPVFTDYVGETLGQQDVQIQSRVDGWVTGIYFKEGDLVQKGQLLYTIDDLPIKNKINEAEARLAEANAIKVNNKAELDRVEPLAAMHALSQRDLDAATAAYKASMSKVDAAEAALRNAKIELDYTKVTSPITGIIGISKVLVGDYIAKLNTDGPLNTVSSIGSVRVRFPITEDEYLKFAKRKTNNNYKILQNQVQAKLILNDGSLYNETGSVSLANRQIDNETGSLIIQADFPNPQSLLRPGQYVKVRLQTDEYANAIIVPQQAINQMQSIYQVFIINDSSKVEPKVVKVGSRVGSNWVVTAGLKPGEKVALLGNIAVNTKAPVKPVLKNWDYDSTSIK